MGYARIAWKFFGSILLIEATIPSKSKVPSLPLNKFT